MLAFFHEGRRKLCPGGPITLYCIVAMPMSKGHVAIAAFFER